MSKLKDPDVLIYAGKLYSSGMNYSDISRNIQEKFGIEANSTQVKKIIALFQNRKSDLIEGDNKLKQMVKGAILDTKKELERIHQECIDILDEAKRIKDFRSRISAIREIRGQLELQEKIIQRITSIGGGSKINKLELTQVIVNSLEDLEKQGVIKILKKPDHYKTIGIESEYFIEDKEEENERKDENGKSKKKIIVEQER